MSVGKPVECCLLARGPYSLPPICVHARLVEAAEEDERAI